MKFQGGLGGGVASREVRDTGLDFSFFQHPVPGFSGNSWRNLCRNIGVIKVLDMIYLGE